MSKIDTGFLPSSTREVFQTLSAQKFMLRYTLIGGTALAIQIKHRFSEDLDFIADSETLIYVNDLPEENMGSHLAPVENISKQQISEFFISELKKIKNKLV